MENFSIGDVVDVDNIGRCEVVNPLEGSINMQVEQAGARAQKGPGQKTGSESQSQERGPLMAALGFADAVRAAGDDWLRYGWFKAFDRGDARAKSAWLLADGHVAADKVDQVRYQLLCERADRASRRARMAIMAGGE